MPSDSGPPSLLEVVYDPDLSTLFLRSLLATGDDIKARTFVFLKHSLHASYLCRPHREIVDEFQRLFFLFICTEFPAHINLTPDSYDRICRRMYDPTRTTKIDQHFFAEANEDCMNILRPDYEEFIKQNIWKQVSSFERIPEPSVSTVARHRGLRASFQAYMDQCMTSSTMAVSSLSLPDEETGSSATGDDGKKKESEEESSDRPLVKSEERAPGVYTMTSGLWDFIVKAEKLRENHELDVTAASSSKSTAVKGSVALSSSSKEGATAQSSQSGTSDKKSSASTTDSDNAKRLYKKFKKLLPVTFSGEGSLSAFLVKVLDNALMSVRSSDEFINWMGTNEWKKIPFPFNVNQSFQKDGFMEYPTLAAALTGPLERLCTVFYPEGTASLQFLKEVMGYMALFNDSAAAQNKKTIKTSSKSIQQRYFVEQVGDFKFPKEIVEEVKASVGSLSSSKLTQHVFQRAAAWVYHRSTYSWFRDFQSSLLWTVREYNNHSAQAIAVMDEFNRSCISGIPLNLDPTIDDVAVNPRLTQSFFEYLPQGDSASFVSFLTGATSMHSSGRTYLSREEAGNMMGLLSSCARPDVTFMAGYCRVAQDLLEHSKSQSKATVTAPFDAAACQILMYLSDKFIENWVEDCHGDFESIPWEPSPIVRINALIDDKFIARAKSSEFAATLITSDVGSGPDQSLNLEASGSTETGDAGLSASSDPEAAKKGKRPKAKGVGEGSSVTLPDGSQVGGEADGGNALSQSSIVSIAPRIPKIEQTLQSTLLRQLFEEQVLQTSLSGEELDAWHEFTAFYTKFISIKDDQFVDEQENIRKEAQEIFDRHWKLMRNSDYLRSRLSKEDCYITPLFFLEEESKMFAAAHSKFEGVLRHAGWKSQN